MDACIVDGELGDGTALDVRATLGAQRPVVIDTHNALLLRALHAALSSIWTR